MSKERAIKLNESILVLKKEIIDKQKELDKLILELLILKEQE